MIAERAKASAKAIAGLLLHSPFDALKHLDQATLAEVLAYEGAGEPVSEVFRAAQSILKRGQEIHVHDLQGAVLAAGVDIVDIEGLIDLAPPPHAIIGCAEEVLDHILRRDALKQISDADINISATVQDISDRLRAVQASKAPVESITLAQIEKPKPEEENPAALFRNGYLRKGGAMMLVATSGVGKSVFSIQACLHWAAGLEAFGIEPVRPLRIAIFQTEDDPEELYDFRENIITGMVAAGVSHKEKATEAAENVIIVDCVGAVGDEFTARLDHFLTQNADIDLVVVNPLQGVFGGDLSKNSELSAFLRAGIDPVIKPARAGMLVIHHTNKPPSSKDRNGWGSDAFAAYVGAGGAELTNWVRAALSLMPCDHAPGVFRLTAAKRGQKLAWRDDADLPVLHRFIAHSDGHIYWRDADYSEGQPPEKESKKRGGEPVQVNWGALFGGRSMNYTELLAAVRHGEGIGANAAKAAIREAVLENLLTATKDGRTTIYRETSSR